MMRACDCCLRKRARYYCLADDAFLCQKCDGLVHSANPFACRHDRVRLKNISFKSIIRPTLPSWHRGSAIKSRTPRKSGLQRSKSEESTNPNQNQLYAVPELEVEEITTSSHDDEADDSKLIQLVPNLDPFGSELCSSTSTSSGPTMDVEGSSVVMSHMMMGRGKPEDEYPPSDLYLDQFAADVETLLGKGLDGEEPYGIKELGLLECYYDTPSGNDGNTPVDFLREVKAEDNDQSGTMSNKEGDMIEVCNDDVENGEPFDFSFDNCDDDREGDEQKGGYFKALMENFNEGGDNSNDILSKMEEEEKEKEVEIKGKKIILRLDYEAISEAWANQGSPWIDGQRPQINHDHYWPHFMGACGVQIMHNPLHLDQEMGGVGVINDSGREARVLRYREKRRTRLFAKKIRYEVRKLNAEKRPRMKGRFVKRSSFASTPTPSNSICI